MKTILDSINSPRELKSLSSSQLKQLATEIRQLIISTCAENGGHLAPGLGVVELTLALHKVFNSPTDKIIWDVGHQAYAHKIITGRRDSFSTLRKKGGISGFPKRAESVHDAFDVGHSSTSISAALGMAGGRDLKREKNKVIAVIGDGSMTGGIAFEGLNHAGHLNKDLIIVLNDNEMSIAENVGAISNFLSRTMTNEFVHKIKKDMESFLEGLDDFGRNALKVAKRAEETLKGIFTPGMLFEAFGFEYIGPIDGHNLEQLADTFEKLSTFDDAVLVHVLTKKGKGYPPAENNPALFHGVGPFDLLTGKVHKAKSAPASYTAVFGDTLLKLAADDDQIVAITAAMPDGTGLSKFSREYPERFFDVGIAEQHGVTFAAGLAAEGLKPVFAIYSSFLQRGYDQLIHDVCLQNLPVVFAIDRGGVVGSDGPTHHGVFDLSFLRAVPGLTLMAPKDENELQHMLASALQYNSPVAIRYPRGSGLGVPLDQFFQIIGSGTAEILRESVNGPVILAVGNMVHKSVEAAEILSQQGIDVSVVNIRFIKPLDAQTILPLVKNRHLFTVEDNSLQGGFGSSVLEMLEEEQLPVLSVTRLGYPDLYIEQGEQAELYEHYGLTPSAIAELIKGQIS
ncbi:MAG: 1-deoxy-D-xylulose-5-phosphate synthase [Geobacteraceae bacterium]|nr:1-deoxy-D-xylulose-5-phosphate synthase [Geobacteraceae bacterium]